MSFPSTLTAAIDGVTEIVSAHLNNLEEKVGVDNSAIASSLDYQLKNASSVDPGHKHTAGAFTGGVIGDVFFKDPADGLWKPAGPDSASLVARTGAQSIAGVKTFTSIPILPASDPIADNEATRKAYVNAQDALKVSKAGDTMSGPLAMGAQNITDVGTLVAGTAQLTNPLAVIYGGIGSQSPVRGDILVASNATTLQLLASVAANSVLVSAGVAQVPFWSKVDLRTMVQFVLPAPNGGTGQSSYAVGDLLCASASDSLSKLAAVAVGQVLVSGGVGAAPAWSAAPVLTTSLTVPIIYGSAASGGDLTLHSTSHATKGKIYLGSNSVYDQVSDNLGIGAIAFGTSAAKVLGMGAGTAPTTAPADMAQMWVADINGAAGYAGLHKRTETTNLSEVVPGVVIKTDTGSPANPYEGLMEINTFDSKINMYADAAWRQLATW
ncbi:MAG: hypothetical protein KKD99_09635 [Proteobacteria bacterium]|nr:hypothetical protein [Pseudomonadota bacterium]